MYPKGSSFLLIRIITDAASIYNYAYYTPKFLIGSKYFSFTQKDEKHYKYFYDRYIKNVIY